ncbi:hypothetical protein BSL82_03340 [Tardibacter chloracetimidivorans]|uniref:Holin n=1 Tax=Tardibacter chloracetimidivorans TaxID=1921510 RepID=A0A1L3ZS40_9SPHN|nr:hypothetical protein BSL82_03340 [Tardibacter chloracetimidivorans]
MTSLTNHQSTGEYLMDATKAAPPVAVSTAALAGMSLQDWVLVATLVYTVIQTALALYRAYRNHKDGKL